MSDAFVGLRKRLVSIWYLEEELRRKFKIYKTCLSDLEKASFPLILVLEGVENIGFVTYFPKSSLDQPWSQWFGESFLVSGDKMKELNTNEDGK